MKFFLENESLAIAVESKGAELQQLHCKQTNTDYMWSGDPAYWGKYSPVLFPIVGTLINNTYCIGQNQYQLPRHGFARDKDFEITSQSNQQVILSLSQDEQTLAAYPFNFLLQLTYSMQDNGLRCSYFVKNTGHQPMPFSLGAHPAFAVPFLPDTAYEDYFLEFEKDDLLTRWKLSNNGLISNQTENIILQNNRLPLNAKLFEEDAIVLKGMKSTKLRLACTKAQHGFDFSFQHFPFFGIWAAKNAPFVCLEPWQGIADNENHNQDILQKEGIKILQPGQTWSAYWEVAVF